MSLWMQSLSDTPWFHQFKCSLYHITLLVFAHVHILHILAYSLDSCSHSINFHISIILCNSNKDYIKLAFNRGSTNAHFLCNFFIFISKVSPCYHNLHHFLFNSILIVCGGNWCNLSAIPNMMHLYYILFSGIWTLPQGISLCCVVC